MFDFVLDRDAVLRDLALEEADPDLQKEILDNLYAQLTLRMRVRIGGELSEQEMNEFADAAEKDAAEGKAWLERRFPDHETMYRQELANLIDEMNGHADMVETVSRHLEQDRPD